MATLATIQLPPNPLWLTAGHWLIVAAYAVLPIVLAVVAWRRPTLRGDAVATLVAGVLIGTGLAAGYAWLIAGSILRVSPTSVALSAWLGVGLLAIFKIGDGLVTRLGMRLVRPWLAKRDRLGRRSLRALVQFGRVLVIAVLGLPLLAASTMVFRPKAVPDVIPPMPFERAMFDAADGMPIAAWFVPSLRPTSASVLVVPGLGSGKADVLPVVVALAQNGYNVLAIDPRAHGESGGSLTTFGDRERLDVAAAFDWLRRAYPEQSAQVFGLGVSMGGAALVAAAGSDGGPRFDGLAVIDTYDDLPRLATAMIDRQFAFAPPVRWATKLLGVPLISLHAGRPLGAFRPADLVANAWPTPVLVVHSRSDELIPFAAGQRLYRAAEEPKRARWVADLDHTGVFLDEGVLREVLLFFALSADFEPVI